VTRVLVAAVVAVIESPPPILVGCNCQTGRAAGGHQVAVEERT
jgi:hypothetical protein